MKRVWIGTLVVVVAIAGISTYVYTQRTPNVLASGQTVTIPHTVVIATEYASAGGCQDTGRNVRIGIPNFQLLDLAFHDAGSGISGLSLRETTKVGNSGWRNVHFDPAGGVLSLDLFAGGGGSVQCIPLVGCPCVGSSGGSIGAEVTAHYKQGLSFQVP
jgi:hypothetical protein